MIDKITGKMQDAVHNEASIFQYCLPASSICFVSLCFAMSDLSQVLLHNVTWAQKNNMMQKNIAEMLNLVPTVHGCYRQTYGRICHYIDQT